MAPWCSPTGLWLLSCWSSKRWSAGAACGEGGSGWVSSPGRLRWATVAQALSIAVLRVSLWNLLQDRGVFFVLGTWRCPEVQSSLPLQKVGRVSTPGSMLTLPGCPPAPGLCPQPLPHVPCSVTLALLLHLCTPHWAPHLPAPQVFLWGRERVDRLSHVSGICGTQEQGQGQTQSDGLQA